MVTTYNPRSPSQINILVSDEAALKFGEKAADFTVRGTNLTYQLGIGDALMRLRRQAQRETGTNDIDSKRYKDAFHRLLEQRPKLARVNNNLRSAALYCIEHHLTAQTIIARLEKNDDTALHMMGVRGLATRITEEVRSEIGDGDDGDDVDLMDEPERRRQRGPTVRERHDALALKYNELARKHNAALHDVRQTGMGWRVDAGCFLNDPVQHGDWLKAQREAAAEQAAKTAVEIAKLGDSGSTSDDEEPDGDDP
jgi:hypothetical protein